MSESVNIKHTKIPNDLLDKHMADMGIAELKVVLFAMRQTLGYHRASDGISLSQFMKATGLSRQGVLDGIENAKKRGVLCEATRGKRGVVIYCIEVEVLEEAPSTSQASRLVKPVDQSIEATSTSQASRPERAATSQASRHTKERVLKETIERNKDKSVERAAQTDAHASSIFPPPPVLQAKAHPVFKAYVRGRGGIEPQVPPQNANDMLDTLGAIQADIDKKLYTLQDVEDLVSYKLSIPHSKAFLLSYIKTDIADFVNGRKAASNGNGAHAPPAAAAASTSGGYAEIKRQAELAKQQQAEREAKQHGSS